ncbi:hypothetical protein L3Y34_006162 [Caenorhabditis briggsae]|uniref:Uncharacterized protein n=1 Tax=Caenorhabditis briggsae TaxID=6238 RepID=A0AAE8ZWW1_CAEBR|nr:hypothetical protein L3Y34_006162 [Caenorhabditis briggsae]
MLEFSSPTTLFPISRSSLWYLKRDEPIAIHLSFFKPKSSGIRKKKSEPIMKVKTNQYWCDLDPNRVWRAPTPKIPEDSMNSGIQDNGKPGG